MIFSLFTLLLLSILMMIMSMLFLFKNTFIYISFPLINFWFLNISTSMILDWMSCLFLSTVLIISSMIMLFSIYYIPEEEQPRFSLMLLMFILSMSILIMSNNLFLILLGWDMLGMSSYILVIYYQNSSSAASGSITLLSNRIGDIFILLSISMLIYICNWEFNMNEDYSLIIMFMLMLAACTKSAQFPFSAWLPMAMSAPTPISALVHSSTLVTAGVFLMVRIMENMHPTTSLFLMTISSITALYASMSANWEQDLKKIIALSTLSQMAIMMFAISIYSTLLAFFHLVIHAFFKSLMFMCAGTMIHETSYQDMRKMSFMSKCYPLISSTLGVASMALMGIPFMSGFFSKDSIIEKLINSKMECILSISMIISIGMTASYSFRMITLSNNYFSKSKLDLFNHTSIQSNLSILMMIPMSIILGTLMMWIINPLWTMFFFPNFFKFTIMFMLLMGLSLGLMLSFKSIKFKMLGKPAILLWFIHIMSTMLMNMFSPLMNLFFWLDKSWQEEFGPKKTFTMNMLMMSFTETINSLQMMTLVMMMIIPIIF
uniref:NADH-ubiquinone oxidoreductase chain 5 n=1 Tax=Oxytate striatipes TaxID=1112455 RepID=A0A0U1XHM3_OXYST|nr:NADH dehydrogenase subunit 5 [Oxytate striatipes]AIT96924.1 NADH dehydrogenase subunit 5 [Oxytate striatipes]